VFLCVKLKYLRKLRTHFDDIFKEERLRAGENQLPFVEDLYSFLNPV